MKSRSDIQLQLISRFLECAESFDAVSNIQGKDLMLVLDGSSRSVSRMSSCGSASVIKYSVYRSVCRFLQALSGLVLSSSSGSPMAARVTVSIVVYWGRSLESGTGGDGREFELIAYRLPVISAADAALRTESSNALGFSTAAINELLSVVHQRYLTVMCGGTAAATYSIDMLKAGLDGLLLQPSLSDDNDGSVMHLVLFTACDAQAYPKTIGALDDICRLRLLMSAYSVDLTVYTCGCVSLRCNHDIRLTDLYHLTVTCHGQLFDLTDDDSGGDAFASVLSSPESSTIMDTNRSIFEYENYADVDNVDSDEFYYYVLEDTVLTASWLHFVESKLLQGFQVVYSEVSPSDGSSFPEHYQNSYAQKRRQFAFALEFPVSPMVSLWCRMGFTLANDTVPNNSKVSSPILIKVQYLLLSKGFIIEKFKEIVSSGSVAVQSDSLLDLQHMTKYLINLTDRIMTNSKTSRIVHNLSIEREFRFFKTISIGTPIANPGRNVRHLIMKMLANGLEKLQFNEMGDVAWKRETSGDCIEAIHASDDEDIHFHIQLSYLARGTVRKKPPKTVTDIQLLLDSIQQAASAFCKLRDTFSTNLKIESNVSHLASLLKYCQTKAAVDSFEFLADVKSEGDVVILNSNTNFTVDGLYQEAKTMCQHGEPNQLVFYRLYLIIEAISHGYKFLQSDPSNNAVNFVVKLAAESFLIISLPHPASLKTFPDEFKVIISYFSEVSLVNGHSGDAVEDLYFESKVVQTLMHNAYGRLVFSMVNLGKQVNGDRVRFDGFQKRQIDIDITDMLNNLSTRDRSDIVDYVDRNMAILVDDKLIRIGDSLFTSRSGDPLKDAFNSKMFFISFSFDMTNIENVIMPESLQSYEGEPEYDGTDTENQSSWIGFSNLVGLYAENPSKRVKIALRAWFLKYQQSCDEDAGNILNEIDRFFAFVSLKLWFLQSKSPILDKEVEEIFARCSSAKSHRLVDMNLIRNTKECRDAISSKISNVNFPYAAHVVTSPGKTMCLLRQTTSQQAGLNIDLNAVAEIVVLAKVKETHISVDFAALQDDSSLGSAIAQTLDRLNQCIYDVNQSELLRELNETRIASKYLIPPCISDALEEDETELSTIYDIGEFHLPLFIKKTYPLHWRCKPSVAVNLLSGNVFHPFAVSNRNNYFVYAVDRRIFYFHIFASNESHGSLNDIAHDASLNSPDTLSPSPQLNMQSPTTASKTAFSRSQSDLSAGIVFELFGTAISQDAVEQISSLIETKIRGLTLNLIATYLSRNITSRLSIADVNFLIPDTREPDLRLNFDIPLLKVSSIFRLNSFR